MLGIYMEYSEQAEVTQWPARLALVVVMIALIALALWGMRRGWRARQRRQSAIPAPAASPQDPGSLSEPVAGLYLGTSRHGDWMDRIAVHGLGVRSRATIALSASGLWLDREGAPGLWIPADDVASVRSDRGVANTVRSRDSVAVVTWRLGEVLVDTGFRADATDDHLTVLDGLMARYGTGVQS